MRLNRVLYILAALVALIGMDAAAQGNRVSPHETVELALNGKKITVTYGRPYMKGRKVVGGDLVPYGKVWRTGADEATVLTTEADLTIGSLAIPKGSYSLFTLPSETGWKLIVNKVDKQWGAFEYNEKQDLGRVEMKVGKTSAPVEQFTIKLGNAGNGGTMRLEWENTSASVVFTAK
ncbi:MAG TPA: DUF2911 domain-containing protein [Blastocatellia bacterium]|nr:DUF2911 domain-containing protein [Blastocatellia bacterium]